MGCFPARPNTPTVSHGVHPFVHASCLLSVTIVVTEVAFILDHTYHRTHSRALLLPLPSVSLPPFPCISHPFSADTSELTCIQPNKLMLTQRATSTPSLLKNRCLIVHIATTDLAQFSFVQQPQIARSGRVARPRPRRFTLYLLTFASFFFLVACICNCHLHHAALLRFHAAYFFVFVFFFFPLLLLLLHL